MRARRWDRAAQENTANPTPWLMRPNAYDIKLQIDRTTQTVYIGPVVPKQPLAQRPYDNGNIIWEGAAPVDSVVAQDDFGVDHTSDVAWWDFANDFSHVANGKQDFTDAQGMAIFKKAPKAVDQVVVAKFQLVAGSHAGVSGLVPAFSVQDSWADLFSFGLYWQDVGGACWMQSSGISIVSDVFYLDLNTDYWLRTRSAFKAPDQAEVSCAIFRSNPDQNTTPLFRHAATVGGAAKLATPGYTGLHMIGPEVLLDEYRVEALGSDPAGTLESFDFKSRVGHQYSGAPKWRTIKIQWRMGNLVLAETPYQVFV